LVRGQSIASMLIACMTLQLQEIILSAHPYFQSRGYNSSLVYCSHFQSTPL
jgi:hypothetical protein